MSRFCLLAATLAALLGPIFGQSVQQTINLAVAGNGLSENPFGLAVDPDGIHAYVAISGDLDQSFPSTPLTAPLFNNSLVMKINYRTGAVLATGQVGLFPEDVAITLNAAGQTRHVFVTNSTSGTVSILDANLTNIIDVTLSPCFGSNFGAVFPFGIVAAPDGSKVYVGTLGGCGTIDVIDSDPLSASFSQIIQSFTVPNMGGRMTWTSYPQLVIAATEFSTQTAGITVVDVTNPASATYFPGLMTPGVFGFGPGTTDVAARPGGTVLLPVSFDSVPRLLEMDPATGAVLQNLDLSAHISVVSLHGIGISEDGTRAVLTAIDGPGEVAFIDVPQGLVLSVLPQGLLTRPNTAVFSPDQGRVLVSSQGAEQVVVYADLPGFDLRTATAPQSALGQLASVVVDNLELGQPGALYASLVGAGPQALAGGLVLHLDNPIAPVALFLGNAQGGGGLTALLPLDPSLLGLTVWFQAATVDLDGGIRLSNGTQTTFF